MSKKKLSKDAKEQIKQLQELISDIEDKGECDVLYTVALAGAELPSTRSIEGIMSRRGGCHSANIARLSTLLQYRAGGMQDQMFSK